LNSKGAEPRVLLSADAFCHSKLLAVKQFIISTAAFITLRIRSRGLSRQLAYNPRSRGGIFDGVSPSGESNSRVAPTQSATQQRAWPSITPFCWKQHPPKTIAGVQAQAVATFGPATAKPLRKIPTADNDDFSDPSAELLRPSVATRKMTASLKNLTNAPPANGETSRPVPFNNIPFAFNSEPFTQFGNSFPILWPVFHRILPALWLAFQTFCLKITANRWFGYLFTTPPNRPCPSRWGEFTPRWSFADLQFKFDDDQGPA